MAKQPVKKQFLFSRGPKGRERPPSKPCPANPIMLYPQCATLKGSETCLV
jgi:hypothetical protein